MVKSDSSVMIDMAITMPMVKESVPVQKGSALILIPGYLPRKGLSELSILLQESLLPRMYCSRYRRI